MGWPNGNANAASATTSGASKTDMAGIIIPAILSMATGVAGGFSSKSAAGVEAQLMRDQGALSRQEAEREAQLHERSGHKFVERQTMAYAKSGVLPTEGSPLLILDETRRAVKEEASAMRSRGLAIQRLYGLKANSVSNAGRNALLGSIGSALATGAGAYFSLNKIGAFGSKKASPSQPTPDLQPIDTPILQ